MKIIDYNTLFDWLENQIENCRLDAHFNAYEDDRLLLGAVVAYRNVLSYIKSKL